MSSLTFQVLSLKISYLKQLKNLKNVISKKFMNRNYTK